MGVSSFLEPKLFRLSCPISILLGAERSVYKNEGDDLSELADQPLCACTRETLFVLTCFVIDLDAKPMEFQANEELDPAIAWVIDGRGLNLVSLQKLSHHLNVMCFLLWDGMHRYRFDPKVTHARAIGLN